MNSFRLISRWLLVAFISIGLASCDKVEDLSLSFDLNSLSLDLNSIPNVDNSVDDTDSSPSTIIGWSDDDKAVMIGVIGEVLPYGSFSDECSVSEEDDDGVTLQIYDPNAGNIIAEYMVALESNGYEYDSVYEDDFTYYYFTKQTDDGLIVIQLVNEANEFILVAWMEETVVISGTINGSTWGVDADQLLIDVVGEKLPTLPVNADFEMTLSSDATGPFIYIVAYDTGDIISAYTTTLLTGYTSDGSENYEGATYYYFCKEFSDGVIWIELCYYNTENVTTICFWFESDNEPGSEDYIMGTINGNSWGSAGDDLLRDVVGTLIPTIPVNGAEYDMGVATDEYGDFIWIYVYDTGNAVSSYKTKLGTAGYYDEGDSDDGYGNTVSVFSLETTNGWYVIQFLYYSDDDCMEVIAWFEGDGTGGGDTPVIDDGDVVLTTEGFPTVYGTNVSVSVGGYTLSATNVAVYNANDGIQFKKNESVLTNTTAFPPIDTITFVTGKTSTGTLSVKAGTSANPTTEITASSNGLTFNLNGATYFSITAKTNAMYFSSIIIVFK